MPRFRGLESVVFVSLFFISCTTRRYPHCCYPCFFSFFPVFVSSTCTASIVYFSFFFFAFIFFVTIPPPYALLWHEKATSFKKKSQQISPEKKDLYKGAGGWHTDIPLITTTSLPPSVPLNSTGTLLRYHVCVVPVISHKKHPSSTTTISHDDQSKQIFYDHPALVSLHLMWAGPLPLSTFALLLYCVFPLMPCARSVDCLQSTWRLECSR